MTERLLLDTHIALWLDSGDTRLRRSTRTAIDTCWKSGGTIYLSAVSVLEIAVLVHKGYVELDIPLSEWLDRFFGRPGLEPANLDHVAASRAYDYPLMHEDPADRLLIATAINLGCPLVTYDDRIRRFARTRGRQQGLAVVA